MLLEKTNRFWKAGLIEKIKKTLLFVNDNTDIADNDGGQRRNTGSIRY